MTPEPKDAIFFETPAQFRRWLTKNHAKMTELWVGFYLKAAARRGITWAEAVDEALCFGWIDGVGARVDDQRRATRFTPRKPRSIWSKRNVERAQEMIRLGRMRPSGLAAFEARVAARTGIYSHEQRNVALPRAAERKFRADADAWAFFRSQAPSYQRAAIWWVVSAKKEETKDRRLETLIDDSRNNRRIKQLRPRT